MNLFSKTAGKRKKPAVVRERNTAKTIFLMADFRLTRNERIKIRTGVKIKKVRLWARIKPDKERTAKVRFRRLYFWANFIKVKSTRGIKAKAVSSPTAPRT